jgi:hypothetical protein
MNNKKYLSAFAMAVIAAGLVGVVPAFAQTSGSGSAFSGGAQGGMMRGGYGGGARGRGVFGTVSAESGTTLTVTSNMMRQRSTSTTATAPAATTIYTVDASNAKVSKNGTSSAVSDIAVGDTVMVQGTVTGTNVVATTIRDGVAGAPGMQGFGKGGGRGASSSTRPSSTPIISGNGEPVIAGSIASVSGETIMVSNKSNITYTVDVTNAKITKAGTSTAISSLATGDNVIIQGTVNGTSVAASSVIDQGAGSGSGTNTNPGNGGSQGNHLGFFGSIGSFFKHLFGF